MLIKSPLLGYLADISVAGGVPDAGSVAYLALMEQISKISPQVASSIVAELIAQRSNLKMIASENYSSLAVQAALGNLLTDKYAEGIPYHRYYEGCENVDSVEALGASLACSLFGADHAYMQPHSGTDANLVAYWAILSARVQSPFLEEIGKKDVSVLSDPEWKELRNRFGNQRLLAMDLYSGGHLSHGYRLNVSGRMFDVGYYGVNRETKLIEYEDVRRKAREFKPLVLLAGYSAYSRRIDFQALREIADEVGAVFMVDMAHFAGLVAGKVFVEEFDPVSHADIITTTTHKTLRGPRGGMVLCREEFSNHVDKGCPLVQGGPMPHVMAAKAVALQEASTETFRNYASRIVENAAGLANYCLEEGIDVLTGGTDNHLILIDVTPFGLTGRQAEGALREANITLNRNTLPFDANGPWYTSGLRFGTPALTSLGMDVTEMREIASIIKIILSDTRANKIARGRSVSVPSKAKYTVNVDSLAQARARIANLLEQFVLYPEIDLKYLQETNIESK